MELLLALVAVCVIAFAAIVVVKLLKKHWRTALGWAAAVLIAVIGIRLLPLFGTAGKVVTVLVIVACFGVLIARAVYYWMGYGSYPDWLERVGIGKLKDAPGIEKAHNWAVERGYVESIDAVQFDVDEYVLSVKFRDKLLHELEQRGAWTKPEFQKCCRKMSWGFRTEYFEILLTCLSDSSHLLACGPEGPYLSRKLVSGCEHLLDQEGAATESEFAELCGSSDIASFLHEERNLLAKAILESMVRSGKAERVAQNTGVSGSNGDYLYVSKNPAANCRMTRREINLDG